MSLLYSYVTTSKICVFTKTKCSYCVKAKTLLRDEYGDVNNQIIDLDCLSEGKSIATELRLKTSQNTVPNIFINGKHIGGYTELLNLHNSGELRNKINTNSDANQNTKCLYICDCCGKLSLSSQLKCNCFNNGFSDWGAPS